MKVMKFGGTSVGKPERMHQVSELITRDNQPTLVVLSALSGTTNSLVDISQALAEGNKEVANEKINLLQEHYRQFVDQLLSQPATNEKGHRVVTEHFDFLQIILRISFSEALNKDILAQGELLSTRLFSLYLE
jgi:aspartate kinase